MVSWELGISRDRIEGDWGRIRVGDSLIQVMKSWAFAVAIVTSIFAYELVFLCVVLVKVFRMSEELLRNIYLRAGGVVYRDDSGYFPACRCQGHVRQYNY